MTVIEDPEASRPLTVHFILRVYVYDQREPTRSMSMYARVSIFNNGQREIERFYIYN